MTYTKAELLNFLDWLWDETCPARVDEISGRRPAGYFFGHPSTRVVKNWDATGNRHDGEVRWMLPEFNCFTVKRISSFVPSDCIERWPIEVAALGKSLIGHDIYGAVASQHLEQEYKKRGPKMQHNQ